MASVAMSCGGSEPVAVELSPPHATAIANTTAEAFALAAGATPTPTSTPTPTPLPTATNTPTPTPAPTPTPEPTRDPRFDIAEQVALEYYSHIIEIMADPEGKDRTRVNQLEAPGTYADGWADQTVAIFTELDIVLTSRPSVDVLPGITEVRSAGSARVVWVGLCVAGSQLADATSRENIDNPLNGSYTVAIEAAVSAGQYLVNSVSETTGVACEQFLTRS